ncbi:glycosyltransferase family 9 protein [Haemophilus parahaemolyticus]|uniref:glycosyltransferase family 9 protein n=1 Tax=Haemophilus parahaemolyticus TaxID=735 RepID=UPI0028EC79B1|nr:glycosyltransferase family 9 protein [Haemophilus parahaemolyticus]
MINKKDYWNNLRKIKVLLNPQGSTREIPVSELDSLISKIDHSEVEFLMTNTKKSEEYFKGLTPKQNLHLSPKTTLLEYFSLINSADIVISVDGGGVHIACSYNKKLLYFYGSDSKNLAKWYPVTTNDFFVVKNNFYSNDKTYGFDMEKAADWFNHQIKLIINKP